MVPFLEEICMSNKKMKRVKLAAVSITKKRFSSLTLIDSHNSSSFPSSFQIKVSPFFLHFYSISDFLFYLFSFLTINGRKAVQNQAFLKACVNVALSTIIISVAFPQALILPSILSTFSTRMAK